MTTVYYDIVIADGDGVGPELINSAIQVLNIFTSFKLQYHRINVGDQCYRDTGAAITDNDIDIFMRYKVMLKGPLTIPSDKSSYMCEIQGRKYTSANQVFRKICYLSSNIRPARSFRNVKTSKFTDVDIITFRQNTEDVYTGEEHMEDNDDTAIGIKRITRDACIQIAVAAFNYAIKHQRKRVTAIHKANVCRMTDGLFLRCCSEVSERAEYNSIQYNECLADSALTKLMIDHTQFDILLCPNLYGDLLSDCVAGMIGSLGLSGAAHIGDTYALFEPTHGSAPDIAGKNAVNPTSMLLSGAMMLAHIGEIKASEQLEAAVRQVIEAGQCVTADLGGKANTQQMTQAVAEALHKIAASV